MFLKDISLLVLATYCTLLSAAQNLHGHTNFGPSRTLRGKRPPLIARDDTPKAQYVQLPIDHLDERSRTFMNRYWVYDSFYKPGGPVFFKDTGEGSADQEVLMMPGSVGEELAKKFNGLLIVWEHRFYGTSFPKVSNDMQFQPDQLAEYFPHHTIEQALEDVAVFAKGFSFDGLPGQDLRPGVTPWVFVGCSYPGARAAWMRSRNPEIFHASLASSAVIQLQVDMWQYYRVIEDTMDSSGYANCSADMRAMARYIDAAVESGDVAALGRIMGNLTNAGPEVLVRFNNVDMTGYIWVDWQVGNSLILAVDTFHDFQDYGLYNTEAFCNLLQQEANKVTGDNIRTSRGIFIEYPGHRDWAAGLYALVLGYWWQLQLQSSPTQTSRRKRSTFSCEGTDKRGIPSLDVVAMASAFYTMSKSRTQSLLPYTLYSFDVWQASCIGDFGPVVASGPDITPVNSKYGGWNMNPSNVLWVDGEFDPWRAVTLNSLEEGSPKRPKTTVIRNSGETPGPDIFFGMVVDGGFHGPDMGYAWNTTGLKAHLLFRNALEKWLPAFEPHEVNVGSSIDKGGGKSGEDKSGDKGGAVRTIGAQVRWLVVAMALVAAAVVIAF